MLRIMLKLYTNNISICATSYLNFQWDHYYLSLAMTLMLLTPLFLKILWTWSREYPATTWPLTWRIWSPNLSPARAAGDPLVTRQTNTPLLMAATRSPTRPSASLHRISCNKHSLYSALEKISLQTIKEATFIIL